MVKLQFPLLELCKSNTSGSAGQARSHGNCPVEAIIASEIALSNIPSDDRVKLDGNQLISALAEKLSAYVVRKDDLNGMVEFHVSGIATDMILLVKMSTTDSLEEFLSKMTVLWNQIEVHHKPAGALQ